MSRAYKKFMKKKEREKEAKKKVLLRREVIRTKAKEDAQWEAEEKKAVSKREPIRNAVSKDQVKEIKEKIKRNKKIIGVLKEESAKEVPIKVSEISISEMVKTEK
jgi:hypothetical protein